MADDNDDFVPILAEAITRVASGPLVTKWVVIAEVVADDGDRQLERFNPPDASSWDILGMLDFHLTFERKRIQTDLDD